VKVTLDISTEIEPEDLEGTIACLVMFGDHWRIGLYRPLHGQAKHKAWRDPCYYSTGPRSAYRFGKNLNDVNTSPEEIDAVTTPSPTSPWQWRIFSPRFSL